MNMISSTAGQGKPMISIEAGMPGLQINPIAEVTRTIAILTGIIIR
jgi:hypothetical protein